VSCLRIFIRKNSLAVLVEKEFDPVKSAAETAVMHLADNISVKVKTSVQRNL